MIHTPCRQLGAINFVASRNPRLRGSVRGPMWLGFVSPILVEHDFAALRLEGDTTGCDRAR